MSRQDFISEYLDSLPPDERREQSRSFEESALLRLAVDRVRDLGPEDQKVLMAEFEVYAETGEVEEGSLFGESCLRTRTRSIMAMRSLAVRPRAGGRRCSVSSLAPGTSGRCATLRRGSLRLTRLSRRS